MDEIEQRLTEILSKAAKCLNLTSYTLNLNLSASTSDGFLSELYKVSLFDNDTNTKTDLVVKIAPKAGMKRQNVCGESAYNNEINFYETVLPTLENFQEERQVSSIFKAVPEYVCSVNEPCRETIVLKDITSFGYQLRDRNLVFDEEHVKRIFDIYGRFHALSFCFKEQKPEEYLNLTKLSSNVFKELGNKYSFSFTLKKFAEIGLEALNPDMDGPIREKFQKYVDTTMETFLESLHYEGDYSGILHGDCWSNNMMFKYKNLKNQSKLESVNLIDFQLMWVGSPVYDLSYFFYSGGSKNLFQKLEYYLDVYYESFSSLAKELGCEPSKILPRQILTDDWKSYSKFGMMMSLLVIKTKLRENENAEELFRERVRTLLTHMYEIKAL